MQSTNALTSIPAEPPRRQRGRPRTKCRAVSAREIEQLVKGAHYLVPMYARSYLGRGVALEDLISAGNVGIVEAAYRFDPDRGVKFSSYAAWWVRKAIASSLETIPAVVTVPRYSFHRRRRVLASIASGRAAGVRAFGEEDAAADLGLSAQQVKRAVSFCGYAISLEEPISPDDHHRLEDRLARPAEEGPEAQAFVHARTRCVQAALAGLSDRRRLVLALRFGVDPDGDEPASLVEVGRKLGLSRERVRQIEMDALNAVRRSLAAAGWSHGGAKSGRGRV